ncbi:hypothetical protein BDR04DRAFT_1098415 [Suillus decipiens]|nr:hypothetical protein BDR04DRAFT_1098415 [Suillus decipiens]
MFQLTGSPESVYDWDHVYAGAYYPACGNGARRPMTSFSTRSFFEPLGPDHILKQPHLSWMRMLAPVRKWMGNIAEIIVRGALSLISEPQPLPVSACGGCPRPNIPPELVMPPKLLTVIECILIYDTRHVLNTVSTNNAFSSMNIERVRMCEWARPFYDSPSCHASNTHPHDRILHSSNNVRVLYIHQSGLSNDLARLSRLLPAPARRLRDA